MKLCTAPLAIAMGLSLSFASQAQQPQTSTAPETSVTFAGVKVGIDPKTGRLRPLSEEESRALSDAMLKSKRSAASAARYGVAPATNADAARTVRKMADGSVSVRVPEEAMAELRADIGADGKVRFYESDMAPNAAQSNNGEAMK